MKKKFNFFYRQNILIFVLVYIFLQKEIVCAQENVSGVAPHYLHSDHLGDITTITDSSGSIEQVIDYYPFGSVRLNKQSGNYNEKRKFIGEIYDEKTGLNYLNARYYDPLLGRFISEDPEFWQLNEEYLIDPQKMNSYSYSQNSPIVFIDPLGLSAAIALSMPKGGWTIGQKMGEFNGVAAYYNGIGSSSTSYSCVEYAKRYVSRNYGMNNIGKVGDAKTMWNMVETINNRLLNSGSDYVFSKNLNGSNTLPQAGDLLFWTEGQYGHVMVVTESGFNNSTNKGYVEIIDQNASNQSVRSLDVKSVNGNYNIMKNATTPVAGWFSPVSANQVGQASTAPKAQVTPNQAPNKTWYQKAWDSAKRFLKNFNKR